METVGNLERLGGALAGTDRLVPAPVAAAHFDAGMGFEPIGQRLGTAVGQQIYGTGPFQVSQNGALPAVATASNVIHTARARRGTLSAPGGAQARQDHRWGRDQAEFP